MPNDKVDDPEYECELEEFVDRVKEPGYRHKEPRTGLVGLKVPAPFNEVIGVAVASERPTEYVCAPQRAKHPLNHGNTPQHCKTLYQIAQMTPSLTAQAMHDSRKNRIPVMTAPPRLRV